MQVLARHGIAFHDQGCCAPESHCAIIKFNFMYKINILRFIAELKKFPSCLKIISWKRSHKKWPLWNSHVIWKGTMQSEKCDGVLAFLLSPSIGLFYDFSIGMLHLLVYLLQNYFNNSVSFEINLKTFKVSKWIREFFVCLKLTVTTAFIHIYSQRH